MEDDIIFDSNSLTIQLSTTLLWTTSMYIKYFLIYITLYTETNTDNIHEVLIQIHKHII